MTLQLLGTRKEEGKLGQLKHCLMHKGLCQARPRRNRLCILQLCFSGTQISDLSQLPKHCDQENIAPKVITLCQNYCNFLWGFQ